jgi:hypothetical protein
LRRAAGGRVEEVEQEIGEAGRLVTVWEVSGPGEHDESAVG